MLKTIRSSQSGFTITELLIVIVVIGILAAITIVAYGSITQSARNNHRKADMITMKKALKLYAIQNGSFPASAPNPGIGGFEISSDPGFLSALGSSVFRDPINSGNVYLYWYKTYPAGAWGPCPASLGQSYALWAAIEGQSAPLLDSGACTSLTPGAAGMANIDYLIVDFAN